MKRYIVCKSALSVLDLCTHDACGELTQEKIITDEGLHFNNLPFLSVMLCDDDVAKLKANGIFPEEEKVQETGIALGITYERVRSHHFKVKKKGLSGKGCKVGVLDSGVNVAVTPAAYHVNFIDANIPSDDHGHGTAVTSIINHPTTGIAPGCEIHHLKIINSGGGTTESAVLAAFDYVIQNNLDVINLSWTFDTTAVRAAVAAVVATNTIVCAASGNQSSDTYILMPSALPGVVSVNAVREDGEPHYKNVIPYPAAYGGRGTGITIACGGIATEHHNRGGGYGGGWGTSFACPFFVGTFAVYKEELKITDNHKVLEYVLSRAKKTTQPLYFGAGFVSF